MSSWGRKSAAGLLAAAVLMLAPAPAAAAGSATRAYAVRTATLIVLDPATNTVSAQVPLGFSPSPRVRPDGAEVYLSDEFGGAIHVLDAATNAVVATITVGGAPTRVAFTPDSRFAYTTNSDLAAVQVIDTASRRVVRTISIDPHRRVDPALRAGRLAGRREGLPRPRPRPR
jgi:YVTN family beta-propeller protein